MNRRRWTPSVRRLHSPRFWVPIEVVDHLLRIHRERAGCPLCEQAARS